MPALHLQADLRPTAGSEAVAARRAVDAPPLQRREPPSPARQLPSPARHDTTSTPAASRLGREIEREIERRDEPARFAGLAPDLAPGLAPDLAPDLARDAATRLQAVWRGTLARDTLERAWEEEEEEAAAALIQAAWREVRSRRREVRLRLSRAEQHDESLPRGSASSSSSGSLHGWQGARRAASAQFGLLHRRGGAAIADVVRAAVAMRKSPASPLAKLSRERTSSQRSSRSSEAETSGERRASDPRATRTMEDAAAAVQASWRGYQVRHLSPELYPYPYPYPYP